MASDRARAQEFEDAIDVRRRTLLVFGQAEATGDPTRQSRKAVVADLGWRRLSGRLAWLLWRAVHLFILIGLRNRLAVLLDWLRAYLTFARGARLITGPLPQPAARGAAGASHSR